MPVNSHPVFTVKHIHSDSLGSYVKSFLKNRKRFLDTTIFSAVYLKRMVDKEAP